MLFLQIIERLLHIDSMSWETKINFTWKYGWNFEQHLKKQYIFVYISLWELNLWKYIRLDVFSHTQKKHNKNYISPWKFRAKNILTWVGVLGLFDKWWPDMMWSVLMFYEKSGGVVPGVYTLYTVHCTLYTEHCTLYTVTVYCTLYTVHWSLERLNGRQE